MASYAQKSVASGIRDLTFGETMEMAKTLHNMLTDAPDSNSSPEAIAWWLNAWAEDWIEQQNEPDSDA